MDIAHMDFTDKLEIVIEKTIPLLPADIGQQIRAMVTKEALITMAGISGAWSLYLQGGPTKKRLTSRPAYAAPWYSFDFVGVRESVLRLLTLAHVGIGYDFFSAANGEFTDVSIIPLDEDSSINAEGRAAHPVPVNAERANAPRPTEISPARCSDSPTSNTQSRFKRRAQNNERQCGNYQRRLQLESPSDSRSTSAQCQ